MRSIVGDVGIRVVGDLLPDHPVEVDRPQGGLALADLPDGCDVCRDALNSYLRDMKGYSDLDAGPGKCFLDGDEFLPDIPKFIVKVFLRVAPEPDNFFFDVSRDLEGLVLLV